jgi:hypothetical protein
MILSAADVREAERGAREQRITLAHLLRSDETKAPSARLTMHMRRIMTAAMERSATYDQLLSDRETQALFDCGALWFCRPGDCFAIGPV